MTPDEYKALGDKFWLQAYELYAEAARLRFEADRLHHDAILAWAKAEPPKPDLGEILCPPVSVPPLDTARPPC